MFTDEEYKSLINPMQHKPTVPENQRFGVHFDYSDLCGRLSTLRDRLKKQSPTDGSKLPSLRTHPSPLPNLRSKSVAKHSARKSQSSISPLKSSLSQSKLRLLRKEQSNRDIKLPACGKPVLRRVRQGETAKLV